MQERKNEARDIPTDTPWIYRKRCTHARRSRLLEMRILPHGFLHDEYMSWFNLNSKTYEVRKMPLGQATENESKRKARNAANRRTSDYEEVQRFLMQALEDNPFDDFGDLHQKALDAGFELSYAKARRARMDLGVKMRNRPAQHWYGPEGVEVVKERRLSYAGDHIAARPYAAYAALEKRHLGRPEISSPWLFIGKVVKSMCFTPLSICYMRDAEIAATREIERTL